MIAPRMRCVSPNSYLSSTNNGLILFSTMDSQRLSICANIRVTVLFSTKTNIENIAPTIQPITACVVVTISVYCVEKKCTWTDSNCRLTSYELAALPLSYRYIKKGRNSPPDDYASDSCLANSACNSSIVILSN